MNLAGKRFFSFIASAASLVGCAVFADPDVFPTLANTIMLVYGIYCGGQSATDWKKASQG